MILRVLILLALFQGLSRLAMAAGISETTNGVYLVVEALHQGDVSTANEFVNFDDQLVWDVFCDAGETELSCPDFKYSLKIRMIDTNGLELPKTEKGKQIGKHYDQLKKITDCKVFPVMAWGGHSPGKPFAKPSELFQIQKPGTYSMEIQMQMFRYVPSRDVDERSKTLFRFSPIKIKVVKP